jgi:hypothetical protein
MARRRAVGDVARGIVAARGSCFMCHEPGRVALFMTPERSDVEICLDCLQRAGQALQYGQSRPHPKPCACQLCCDWRAAQETPAAPPRILSRPIEVDLDAPAGASASPSVTPPPPPPPPPRLREARTCRTCGCSDDDCRGCIERTGRRCTWVDDDLCSACAGVP